MSKSLGNFITIRDLLQNHDPEVLRFLVLSTHYRSPIDFSESALEQSKNSLERIYKLIETVNGIIESDISDSNQEDKEYNNKVRDTRNRFLEAMDNDFNTPDALSIIFDFIRDINRSIDHKDISKNSLNDVRRFLMELRGIFGLNSRIKFVLMIRLMICWKL